MARMAAAAAWGLGKGLYTLHITYDWEIILAVGNISGVQTDEQQ